MRHLFNKDSAALKTTIEQDCEEDVELAKDHEDTESKESEHLDEKIELSSQGGSSHRKETHTLDDSPTIVGSMNPNRMSRMLLKTVSAKNETEGVQIMRER
jgi:hypothetical protein